MKKPDDKLNETTRLVGALLRMPPKLLRESRLESLKEKAARVPA
jgi:hypothetical protein